MYVWQQQAINQLTVQKNCRKLLDIYGQRTHKERKSRGGRALSFDRSRPLSNTSENATSSACHQWHSRTVDIVGHNYTCSICECVRCRISNKCLSALWGPSVRRSQSQAVVYVSIRVCPTVAQLSHNYRQQAGKAFMNYTRQYIV